MGFKLPGKSITSGTNAHRSALKMKAEENAASALKQVLRSDKNKQVDYKNMGKDIVSEFLPKPKKQAKNWSTSLSNLVKRRSGQKKGSDDYNTTQNLINKEMGNKKTHATKLASQSKETQEKKAVIDTKTNEKQGKIVTKAENNAKKDDSGNFKVDYKAERKLVKSEQKKKRQKARLDVKEARKTSGRGSDEVKAAKEARRQTRKDNRTERKQMRKDQKENKAVQKGKLPEYALINKK
jgi:hypothetical protein